MFFENPFSLSKTIFCEEKSKRLREHSSPEKIKWSMEIGWDERNPISNDWTLGNNFIWKSDFEMKEKRQTYVVVCDIYQWVQVEERKTHKKKEKSDNR